MPYQHRNSAPRSRKWPACTRCGRAKGEAGPISLRGLCGDCATTAVADAVRQMHARSGPAYDKYSEAIRESTRRR